MLVDFTKNFKSKDTSRYPKLILAQNENARVCVLENPRLKFVHVLEQPVVDPVTGQHVQETKKNSKGEEYQKDSYSFVGQYVCSGDESVVAEKESDPDNCILCRAITEHAGKFKPAAPKYAVHVIRYRLQAGSSTPAEPFQAELLLWVLSQRKFDKLIDIASEFGDLRKVDLLLTDCKSKNFQNYDISPTNSCFWQSTQDRINFVKQLVEANKGDDAAVDGAIARPISPTATQVDIEKVLERYSMLGRPQQGAQVGEFGAIAQQSNQMAQSESGWGNTAQQAPAFAQQQAPASQQGGMEDLFAGIGTQQPQAQAAPPQQQAPAPQQAAPAQQGWGVQAATPEQQFAAQAPAQQPQAQAAPPQQAPVADTSTVPAQQAPAQQQAPASGTGEALDFASILNQF